MKNKKTRKSVRVYTSRQKMGLVLGLAGIALAFLFAKTFTNGTQLGIVGEPATVSKEQDPLTGLLVDRVDQDRQVYGVMIDEHEDARPQSGIDQAFLVIEASVEAGIPRLLAFFTSDQQVDMIGPVRSARPYFVDWANEFGALYTHVGGSNEALDKISIGITFDLNQFWHGDQFWRSTKRYAPHNVYTSTDLLGAYVEQKRGIGSLSDSLYGVWKFKTAEQTTEHREQEFSVIFSGPEYTTAWVYDQVLKKYYPNKEVVNADKTKAAVGADNVAIVVTDISVIDKIGRRRIRTIGEGDAYIFQDGKKIEGIWIKPSETERLRFFDNEKKEIVMNAGVTWIEVIEDESQLQEVPSEKIREDSVETN